MAARRFGYLAVEHQLFEEVEHRIGGLADDLRDVLQRQRPIGQCIEDLPPLLTPAHVGLWYAFPQADKGIPDLPAYRQPEGEVDDALAIAEQVDV